MGTEFIPSWVQNSSHHGYRIPLHVISVVFFAVFKTQGIPQQAKLLTEISGSFLFAVLQLLLPLVGVPGDLLLLPLVGVPGDQSKVGHHVTGGRDNSREGRGEVPRIVPVTDQVLGREIVDVVEAGQVSLLVVVRLQEGEGEDRAGGDQEEGGDGGHGDVQNTLPHGEGVPVFIPRLSGGKQPTIKI